MNILNIVTALYFVGQIAFATGPDKNLTFSVKKVDGKSVQFLPPASHHFNLEAPSEVIRKGAKSSDKALLDKKEAFITAKWEKDSSDCDIEAQLYLCDDKKTYCVPVKRRFACQKLSAGMQEGEHQSTTSAQGSNEKIKMDYFFVNDLKSAQAKAKTEKKILLIDFFGIWCPPCNFLDEQVFNQKSFRKFEKDYVFLKMDADDPISFDLKSKYNVKGYPTIVFANSELEEISRVVGSRNLKSFTAEMNQALKYKNISLVDRITKANSLKQPEFAFDLADMHLIQDEYDKAMHFYTIALKNGNWTEDRKNKMLSAQIGLIADPKQKAALIESSFLAFPYGYPAYERAQNLMNIATDLKDDSLKNRAYNAQLKNAEYLLKNPNVYKNAEITKPDIYMMLAEVYDHSKEIEKSKDNYFKAYEAYTQLIKDSKQDEDKERSNNLNRIYALHKAGKSEEASQLYEKLQATYPQEFTFFYSHASQLKDLGQFEKAHSKAETAYQHSYGDNQLRAAYMLADIKIKLDRKKEAKDLIEETLKNYKEPEGLKVRSHRYIDRLKKLL